MANLILASKRTFKSGDESEQGTSRAGARHRTSRDKREHRTRASHREQAQAHHSQGWHQAHRQESEHHRQHREQVTRLFNMVGEPQSRPPTKPFNYYDTR